jgi:predicted trehalose synthase
MFGDTTTIRALARRLRERADEIRDLAAALTAGAREVDLVKDLVDEAKDAVQDAAKGTIGRLKELL